MQFFASSHTEIAAHGEPAQAIRLAVWIQLAAAQRREEAGKQTDPERARLLANDALAAESVARNLRSAIERQEERRRRA